MSDRAACNVLIKIVIPALPQIFGSGKSPLPVRYCLCRLRTISIRRLLI